MESSAGAACQCGLPLPRPWVSFMLGLAHGHDRIGLRLARGSRDNCVNTLQIRPRNPSSKQINPGYEVKKTRSSYPGAVCWWLRAA